MSKKKICFICGKNYEYCSDCSGDDAKDTWKIMFHDKDCLAISEIWYAYRGKEITKDEAKERFNKYPQRLQDIFKHTSVPAQEIREIFGVKEEKKEVEAEKPVEAKPEATEEAKAPAAEPAKADNQPKQNQPFVKNKNFKK